MGSVLANSQILSIAISLRAWTGAAAAAAASAAAPMEVMAPKHAASHKKAANNKAVRKKGASNRAPGPWAQGCFHGHHGNDAAAVADESNIQALASISKQRSQADQRFDNSADISAAQLDVLEGVFLSNDGDEFYVGCTLDRRVIGMERMESPPAGMSDLDRSAHCSAPWHQVGCLSMIFRCNRNPSEVQVPFGEVFINLNLGIPLVGSATCKKTVVQTGQMFLPMELPQGCPCFCLAGWSREV